MTHQSTSGAGIRRRRALTNPDASTTDGATSGTWKPEKRLYSDAAFVGTERPVLAPVGSPARRIPGTPFLDPESAEIDGALRPTEAQVRAFRAGLAPIRIPDDDGRFRGMATAALLDNYALQLDNGAVLGAASPYWAFVWARDNSLVVTSFALLGLNKDAWSALRFIYSVQEPDGQWEARYLPDGSGDVPDDRGRQDDGIGYTLWATWVAVELSETTVADQHLGDLRPGILRAIRAAGEVLDPNTGLPRTSQDFWEMDQSEPSLGVAGPLHFGLRCAVQLAARLGEHELATQAERIADRLRAAIDVTYAPIGYQHFPSGGGRDASVAFLLPPFVPDDDDARAAWQTTLTTMRVPNGNGGLRPGEDWPDLETAWNTQTSLYAITAAALDERETARELLAWMDCHRTPLGCLPEKVTVEGQPAAVAPICTVASSVLIALALLDGARLPVPERLDGASVDHPSSPIYNRRYP